jgi:competence protein ComEC
MEAPEVGEEWVVNARLRPPTGFANPAGFDYERWLFSEGIAGTGYVRSGKRVEVALAPWDVRARARIRQLLVPEQTGSTLFGSDVSTAAERPPAAAVGVLRHGGVLLALAIADGSAVADEEWALFRETGTIHLIIVSGLHIVIVAALGTIPGLFAGRLLLLCNPLLPVQYAGVVAGLIAALVYTALTGFEIPAVRAVICYALGAMLLVRARKISPVHALGIGFLLTASVSPLAVLASGFWLSFAAVSLLIAVHASVWRAPVLAGATRQFVISQLLLSLGMGVWVTALVGSVSVTGPLVNLLVIPLVSGIVLPFLLVGCLTIPLSEATAQVLLSVSDFTLDVTMRLLIAAAEPAAIMTPAPRWLPMMVAVTASLLWVLPIPLRVRILLTPLLLLPAVPPGPRLPLGEFSLEVLDVGQGSAALVSTRNAVTVMDTGPRFPSGFDTGRAVVLPALANTVAGQTEAIVITHADLDHAGGAEAVVSRVPEALVLQGEPVMRGVGCFGFPAWVRDGVRFVPLPRIHRGGLSNSNDRSCGLLVDNGRVAVLLTGDTGGTAEMLLLRDVDDDVLERVAVVLVAHHGSRSSSSRAFVRRTHPEFGLISAGRHNPYRHPHPEVVSRWQQAGARIEATAEQGAMYWSSLQPQHLSLYRTEHPRYWRLPAST